MKREKTDNITELLTRGVDTVLVRENLEKRIRSGKSLRIKLGIDPTSPFIHLGRAVVLLKLKDFQDLGHKIILLFGDFTGVIGDTSDKISERPMLERSVVEKNVETYKDQCGKILNMSNVEIHYNSEWLKNLSYQEIAEQANIFSLAEFISRKNIKDRLDKGKRISLREMLYPLMQGYDSVVLRADVELGGTDQWFNLLAGRTMQEYYGQSPQNIITTNIISGLDGRKMSSSWGNVINILDEPDDMFGNIMSLRDDLMISYFVHCTRVPMKEVRKFERDLKNNSVNPRDIKIDLAEEIVSLYWGKDRAKKSAERFVEIFQKKNVPEDIPILVMKEGETLVDFLVRYKITSSKTAARRLIEQGGASLNGEKVTDTNSNVVEGVLRAGKRKVFKLKE